MPFFPLTFHTSIIWLHNNFKNNFLKVLVVSELPWWFSSKESAGQCRRHGFNPCNITPETLRTKVTGYLPDPRLTTDWYTLDRSK